MKPGSLIIGLLCLFGILPRATAALPPLEIGPHTQITRNTVVKPGVYHIEDDGAGAVQISGSNFTIDFSRARLLGAGRAVGGHNPGSWLFGFDKPTLASGESITVVGYVRVETPGVHQFRIGLVAGGFPFIDDNAYRTKITVLS